MTRGSIFAKLSGTGYPNWSSVAAITKERAGLIAQEIVTTGMIGCFGYGLGTMIFSKSSTVGRYEVMLQKVKGIIERYEGTIRSLDKSEEELVQLEESYKKKMEYWSRSSKN